MENFQNINIKKKSSKKYFNINNSNYNIEKEKLIIYLELINTNPEYFYQLKLFDISNNIPLEIVKNSNNNANKYQTFLDYYFGKEQKLLLEIKLKNKNNEKKSSLKTSIGQLIGNNSNQKKGIKIFKLNGLKEQIKIKVEKMKI